MEIQGKIIVVLPERSGVSQRGNQWRSISYVLETQEQYPKKLAFDVTNDKIDQLNIQLGEILTVQFDINAREYNGRWFNSVNAWNVIRQTQQSTAQARAIVGQPSAPYTSHAQPQQPQSTAPSSDPDNLPF